VSGVRTHLDLVAPALALTREPLSQLLAHELDDLGLVLEADLLLGRVDVGVDLGRVEVEAEVDKGVRPLCEEVAVEGFEGALEWRAVDEPVCGAGQGGAERSACASVVSGRSEGRRGARGSLLMKKR